MKKEKVDEITSFLKRELTPALGCTEPIAIAYAAAIARKNLGKEPEQIEVSCSGNIVKNVKGVTVPATNGMRGIRAAAVIGAVAGNADLGLEVLSEVKNEDIERAKALIKSGICSVRTLDGDENLHIVIRMKVQDDWAEAEIKKEHTNIIRIEKNGNVLFLKDEQEEEFSLVPHLSIPEIYEYVNTVNLDDIRDVLNDQIQKNSQISEYGMKNNVGANVGKNMLKNCGRNVRNEAAAYTAAGSDARMSGCPLPVVINSGSGNQGLTVSIPVIVFAKYLNVSEEIELRALAMSNLVALYQKEKIGRLSAYCGAVSAATGSGAAIAYMRGADIDKIEDTITNSISTMSGMVCDGAKSSCAAKIAASVNAAIVAQDLALDGNVYHAGEGMVSDNVETTIANYTGMGRDGMRETDKMILKIMTEQE